MVGLIAVSVAFALAAPSAGVAAEAPETVDGQILLSSDFSVGWAPWQRTGGLGAIDTSSGALCVHVPGGTTQYWSSTVRAGGIPLVAGEHYWLQFTAWSSAPRTVRSLIEANASPWTLAFESRPKLTQRPETFEFAFTAAATHGANQLSLQLGGADEDWEFCLDDVTLRRGGEPPLFSIESGSAVRVNQLGYLPDGPKSATVISDSDEPLTWVLRDEDHGQLATGKTVPRGEDPSASRKVHTIDFGSFTGTGAGLTLSVGDEVSYPFTVADDVYADLPRDALTHFYLARSGIDIDGAIVGSSYARPAGHVGIAPNRGDIRVGCQRPRAWNQNWTCDYALDVRGGWYDAGDQGKYVVNGGIAVYQLLDIAEREGLADPATAESNAYGDGALRVPESGNGVPDILDEARWELEWMLRMQVPAGQPLAGMAHHKVQDDAWTSLPTLPHADARSRQLHRPSTAATLNLAAVAAKGARLYEAYDPAFAAELRTAAGVAWRAATENPSLYAVAEDGREGGGAYDDQEVADEFYWAAAELWLATDEAVYAGYIGSSAIARQAIRAPVALDWRYTAALGHIALARAHQEAADPAETPGGARAIKAVVAGADRVLAAQQAAFFGQAYPQDRAFTWGSNSVMLNNQVLLATAYDLTGDASYRVAAIEGMDYILGRNALNNSYITGYGTSYSENQHHRWMAAQLDPSLPNPFPGTLAGGANAGLQDSFVAGIWPDGCPSQLCYVDDIRSSSTNEMTVSWNSALAWVSAWIVDAASESGVVPGAAAPAVTPSPTPVPSQAAVPTPTPTGGGLFSWLAWLFGL